MWTQAYLSYLAPVILAQTNFDSVSVLCVRHVPLGYSFIHYSFKDQFEMHFDSQMFQILPAVGQSPYGYLGC